MGQKILVTGISGFVAQQLTLDLLEKGYDVRGTLRSLDKVERMQKVFAEHTEHGDRIEYVAADLLSDDGWDAAAEGIDYVHHVASPFHVEQPKDPNDLIIPARDGAIRAIRAAAKAGVKRTIMTSSCAAIAYGYPKMPEMTTEEDWSNPDYTKDCPPYPASKTIAERAAWELVEQEGNGMEFATINPTGIFGPIRSGDVRASLSLIVQLMNGQIPLVPNVGVQIIDVRDVSAAHIAAMEKPEAAGHRFAIAGEYETFMSVSKMLAEMMPEYADKLPTRSMPSFIVRFLALFSETMKTLATELDVRRYTSGEKARTMLLDGRPYISAREAIKTSAETLAKYGAF